MTVCSARAVANLRRFLLVAARTCFILITHINCLTMRSQTARAQASLRGNQRGFFHQDNKQPTTAHRRRRRAVRFVNACTLLSLCIGSVIFFLSFSQGRRLAKKYTLLDTIQEVSNWSYRDVTRALPAITCVNEEQGPCCAPWEYNADNWWTHHPDWEVTYEDHSTFCFSKIQEEPKAEFFRKIHDLQWNANCSEVLQRQQINSGWAASFGRLCDAVWAAVHHGEPVQMTKHWEGMKWLYATDDTSSWAYCENQDMSCYLMPVSPCPPVIGRGDDIRKTGGKKGSMEWLWLKQYVGRMQQHVRKRIFEMMTEEFPSVRLPCTAMHVRRGDSGIPRRPFRRYASISEYLEVGKIQQGDTVVLLTDDASTIKEVQEHHPKYNWIYANRPRNNGTDGGFDGHIPSSDPAYDFVVIQAELQLASKCNKLVHGASSFSDLVYDAIQGSGTNVSRFFVDTVVSKEEAQENYDGDIKARGYLMLNNIHDAYLNGTISA